MPFAEHFMISGVTTAAQTATLPAAININCGFIPTKVQIVNETRFGTNSANWYIQSMLWDSAFSANTKIVYADTLALNSAVVTSNGITPYDGTQSVLLGPAIAGTVITNAAAAVCTTAAHGLQTGDEIIMTNNVVMKQIGGLKFTVTVLSSTTFSIPLDTTVGGLATGGNESGFVIRKVVVPQLFYPNKLTITGISLANPMVVTTSTNHQLTVGQKVRLHVPVAQGTVQADNLEAVITAVTATTFTLGSINSTAFTAFTWPLNTLYRINQASVTPVGSGPSITTTPPFYYEDKLDDATTNIQYQGFSIGTGVLLQATGAVVGIAPSDVLSWTAWRGDV